MLSRICALLLLGGSLVLASQGTPRAVSLVVTNGLIVTMDGTSRVLTSGALAIDGRDIVAVDTPAAIAANFTAADSIDAGGAIVMPGLVNTHTHAPMVLYRGLADDLPLMDWLNKYIFPAEARTVSPEFVRAGTKLAALEMIQSGTTTYADMYYFEEEIARATKEAGLRAVLGETIIQFPSPDSKTPADALARTEAFIRSWKADDLVTPAIAPHALYTLDTGTLKSVRAIADREQVPVLIHLSETRDETTTVRQKYGKSSTAVLDGIGFWGPRTLAAHGVWLTANDMRILAMHHVAVSHNPESNMKLASGTAPVVEMRNAGIAVGLGTDGAASNNDLDMFEAMRQCAFLHKLQTHDPRTMPARTVLRMATIEGARALGMDREIGSLEAGKRADVIIVSIDGARQTPMYDPMSHLVYVARGDDVQTTIVNGRVLMRNRRMSTLDEPAILQEARAWAEKVRSAVAK